MCLTVSSNEQNRYITYGKTLFLLRGAKKSKNREEPRLEERREVNKRRDFFVAGTSFVSQENVFSVARNFFAARTAVIIPCSPFYAHRNMEPQNFISGTSMCPSRSSVIVA